MDLAIYHHPDPVFATALLYKLYSETDTILREDVKQRSYDRAAYLKDMLQSDNIQHPDHRRALTTLLMEQEHIQMLLNLDEPFAAYMAQDPVTSSKPVWPRLSILAPIFILIGFGLGAVFFYMHRKEKHA